MSDAVFSETAELEEMGISDILQAFVHQAADMRASDLFFHTGETSMEIAVRRLGTIQRLAEVTADRGRHLVSYVKAMAGMDISEHRRPLDGRWLHDDDDRRLDLRINTIPTLFGEDMAIRIWNHEMGILKLDELGMTHHEINTLRALLNNPSGLILVTGPTGAGKTATLYACLDYLNDGTRKINTLEDPVEYAMSGIRQAQVRPKLGLDFSELLRSVLRQSPDVIMVGEIRDRDTATTAVRAANSGHLVLATLHAPVAASAVQSMLALGAHPYFLASSLLCIIAQRLVRTLCKKCRIANDISGAPTFDEIKSLLTDGEDEVIYGPGGCDACFHDGYDARTGVFEIMTMSRDIRHLIAEARPRQEIEREAIKSGMIEFKRAALLKVAQGVTSTEEILRDVPPEYLGLED